MTNLQSLAIITTMRNEAKNLTELFKTYKNLCDSFGYVFQFVIVDNNSIDSSLIVASEKAINFQNVQVLSNETIGGYGSGLKFAAHRTNADFVMIIPSDNQYSFYDCHKLISEFIDFQVDGIKQNYFFTHRTLRLDSLYSRIRGIFWRHLVNTVFSLPPSLDPASQLKIVPRAAVTKLFFDDFFWDIENVLFAVQTNSAISVVPVTLHARKYGSSSLSGVLKGELTAMRNLITLLTRHWLNKHNYS
jgi:glycosyltransferase involved in cell wall biosynthesis